MKIKKEEIPVKMESTGTVIRSLPGYGGMAVAYNEVPGGTDFSPLLAGLANNSCHCPHWGYVVEGELTVKYDNGTEDHLTAGDVFYLPPGHTAMVGKNLKFIEFSPEKEFKEVWDHIFQRMAALQKENA